MYGGDNVIKRCRAELLVCIGTIGLRADNFGMGRADTLIKNLRPAIAEPAIAHHQYFFVAGELAGDGLHRVTAASGNDRA